MKLFAKMTSERGKEITKSGNDWLKIEVQDENRNIIFTKTLTAPKPTGGGFRNGKWEDSYATMTPKETPCQCLMCTNARGETDIPF